MHASLEMLLERDAWCMGELPALPHYEKGMPKYIAKSESRRRYSRASREVDGIPVVGAAAAQRADEKHRAIGVEFWQEETGVRVVIWVWCLR